MATNIRSVIRLWAVLMAAAGSAGAVDDFGERMLAAGQLSGHGDYAGAEAILLAALKEADRLSMDEQRKAIVWNNLGSVYDFMNKYPQAEQCYRRAVEIEARLWAGQEVKPYRSLLNLAALYIETGQLAKAERLGLQALLEQPVSQRNRPDFGRLLVLLADLERRRGRYPIAQKYGEEALAILEKLQTDGSLTMDALSNLCLVYGETGRPAEALSRCEQALRIADGLRYVEPSRMVDLLANVGTFQFLVDGPAEAEPFYKRAMRLAENGLGPEHPALGRILLYYAELLERTNRKAEAKKCRRRAKAILEAASTTDIRKYTVDLSELLKRQSRR